jgi:predicted kinase
MATLHFVAGKAGAGKTTLAREIAKATPAILICEDQWLSGLNDPITTVSEYLAATRRWRKLIAPHVVALLRLGVSVVFDFAGNTVRDRQWVRTIFEEADADHLLHELVVLDDVCKGRVRARNEAKPPGLFFGVVSEALVDEVNQYYVAPTEAERFRIVLQAS